MDNIDHFCFLFINLCRLDLLFRVYFFFVWGMCVPKYTVQTADWSLRVHQNYIDDDWRGQWRVDQKQIEYYCMMYSPYTKSH